MIISSVMYRNVGYLPREKHFVVCSLVNLDKCGSWLSSGVSCRGGSTLWKMLWPLGKMPTAGDRFFGMCICRNEFSITQTIPIPKKNQSKPGNIRHTFEYLHQLHYLQCFQDALSLYLSLLLTFPDFQLGWLCSSSSIDYHHVSVGPCWLTAYERSFRTAGRVA